MELKCKIAKALVYRTKDDAWTIIRGRVYNITPYLSFHPGGEDQLMLGAGKDSTALFGTFFFSFQRYGIHRMRVCMCSRRLVQKEREFWFQ